MADNFLERHREDYEMRKQRWILKKRHPGAGKVKRRLERPDDEAL